MKLINDAAEQLSRTALENDTRDVSEIRPTRDDVFEMLSNERRRCAIYYLQRQDGPVDVRSVVDYVAAWQNDTPISEVSTPERKCVYSALHQTHLPKLASVGLIEYDTDRSQVRLRDDAEVARLYLEYDPGNDIAWSSLYLGLATLGTVFAVAYAVGLPPFGTVGAGTLIWGLVVLFGATAGGHVLHDRRNKRSLDELFEVEE